jgi:8-oxo-dGTP diphosphatase
MRVRTASSSRAAPSAAAVSLDVVLVSLRSQELFVLGEAKGTGRRRGFSLPWAMLVRDEPLNAAATRIARRALGGSPGWMEQAGAFADGDHPGGASLSVCYVAVAPWVEPSPAWSWMEMRALPALGTRHRRMVAAALGVVRARVEQAPIVFAMLAREFTLSELQQAYETVLDRRLHKASFRRALQAAFLVEPTGEWRGEGRGRPAQLYRYAPRRKKGERRGVRLDLL